MNIFFLSSNDKKYYKVVTTKPEIFTLVSTYNGISDLLRISKKMKMDLLFKSVAGDATDNSGV